MSLTGRHTPGNEQREQALLLAHRYGLTLDEEEQEELLWIIETMGWEAAEEECARSYAMLVRSRQLEPDACD